MSERTADRIAIITGANSGIGKAAAVEFASEGWQVIMACRALERGRIARQQVIEASGNPTVRLKRVDLSSFDSIRQFCSEFRREFPRLDVLIHNAACFNHGVRTYQFSPDGLELTFATNVFGPLLMTQLLLERLAASSDPRVLNAASTNIKHFFDPKRAIEFDNLRGEFAGRRSYEAYKMYGDSKMALLLLTYRMAEEYRTMGIKVNAVMIPATKVSRETLGKFTGLFRILGPLVQNLNPMSLTPEQVARCYYHICTSEEFRGVTGALVDTHNRILVPAEREPLTPIGVISELWNTRHAPAYASHPETVERMWRMGREVISGALDEP